MPRIPYLTEENITVDHDFMEFIKARRPDGRLLNLDRILLYSEPLARGWQQFFSKLRQELQLSSKFRELAILRVAIVNRAPYEYEQHTAEALNAGISQAQIDALSNWRVSQLFDESEQAVLAYTDAMTQSVQVPAALFERLSTWFDEQQLVELTAIIAGYNMVSRFLEALQISTVGE